MAQHRADRLPRPFRERSRRVGETAGGEDRRRQESERQEGLRREGEQKEEARENPATRPAPLGISRGHEKGG